MSVPSSAHPLTAELLAKRRLGEIDGLVTKGDVAAAQVAGI